MMSDTNTTGKVARLFAALRRPRLPSDRTPDGYYKIPPIRHSAFRPREERPNWLRPHGPRNKSVF
jgi:hypothetical protein